MTASCCCIVCIVSSEDTVPESLLLKVVGDIKGGGSELGSGTWGGGVAVSSGAKKEFCSSDCTIFATVAWSKVSRIVRAPVRLRALCVCQKWSLNAGHVLVASSASSHLVRADL